MIFQKTSDHVPTINQAIKIPINQIVQQDGWSHHVIFDNPVTKQKEFYRVELTADKRQGMQMIVLSVNGEERRWWRLQDEPIAFTELINGGSVPWDKCWHWYVYSMGGKRCRALYLWGNTHIGTRHDLKLRYPSRVLNKKARAAFSQQFDRRRVRKRRAMERRIARYKRRLGMA
jgi:hypothetical protein